VSPAWIWLIVGLVAAGIEVFTLDLTFLLLAAGALSAAGVAAIGAPIWAQVLVGFAVAGVGLAVVRPLALRHLRRTPRAIRTGVDALPGITGRALTTVTIDSGQMRLRGETWSARLDPDVTREPVDAGQALVVTRIEGATALVHPVDE
jgi:membrane protein implicated in regulation of membrane protease activity